MRRILALVFTAGLLLPSAAQAEYRHIELAVFGMD